MNIFSNLKEIKSDDSTKRNIKGKTLKTINYLFFKSHCQFMLLGPALDIFDHAAKVKNIKYTALKYILKLMKCCIFLFNEILTF